MIVSALLFLLYGASSAYFAVQIFRRDMFFAVFFCSLLLYSAFALLGYLYLPELSEFLGIYFGPEVANEAMVFTIASLASVYVFFRWLYMPFVRHSRTRTLKVRPMKPVVLVIFMALLCAQVLFFLAYARALDYALVNDEEHTRSLGLLYKFAIVEFKFSSFYLIVLYALAVLDVGWRARGKAVLLGLLAAHALVFVAICIQLGDRTDLLKALLGIAFIEVMRRADVWTPRAQHWPGSVLASVRPRTWLGIAAAVVSGVVLMLVLEYVRNPGVSIEAGSWAAQKLLFQDYFVPYHMLILAMALSYVDPGKVLLSNAANALVMLQVPYLQAYVMEQEHPGLVTRSSSMAFYLFTEGYMAAGDFGFLYNGLVFCLAMCLWRSLSKTSDPRINVVAGALFVALAADLVRGQSSYVVKYLYLYVAPALVLFGLTVGRIPFGLRLARPAP